MKKTIYMLLFIASLLIGLMSSTFAAVEVFSQYDTDIVINKDKTIDVTKNIRLRNVHSVGIVPGRVEFSIGKKAKGSVSKITVQNISALDRYGNKYPLQVFETADETRIAIDIFTPLLPGFEHIINLKYTIAYEDSGLFFKNLQIPLREDTSITIQRGEVSITLPEGRHFTYISDLPNSSVVEGNVAKWQINSASPGSVKIEYSALPIKLPGFKGSYVFWILINVVLLSILAREVRSELRKYRKKR